jgi:hypothetical protein
METFILLDNCGVLFCMAMLCNGVGHFLSCSRQYFQGYIPTIFVDVIQEC